MSQRIDLITDLNQSDINAINAGARFHYAAD